MFFKFIQTSTTGVVQWFGRSSGTVGPGLRFFIPIIQTITPVSNRITQETFNIKTKTKDNVFVDLGISIQSQIKPEHTELAYFALDDPVSQIDSYVENVVRAKVPQMTLDCLFESQGDICDSVNAQLSEKMGTYGHTIVTTLVTNINPAIEVINAMNQINASERLKDAARNEAEANYIREVKKSEADKERKRLQGEGVSQQRAAILKGYEDGVNNMATRLGLTPREIIEFVREVQELDTMEAIGKSQGTKTLFFKRGDSNRIRDSVMESTEGLSK